MTAEGETKNSMDAGGRGGIDLAPARPEELKEARGKLSELEDLLRGMGSVVVAFSGGVDSAFLLKVAVMTLGDKALGLTATSPTYPEREFSEAKRLAEGMGARHVVVESKELEIPGFSENSTERCYFCKSELFETAIERAGETGFDVVVDGANTDDLEDHRPGSRAAREMGVRSPLQEAGLTKREIRLLSKELGLPTWNKPALACLSSRFPYGTEITEARLEKVAAGEEALRTLGFVQFRVRYHGDTVRLEVEKGEMPRLMEPGVREELVKGFKALGFTYVTFDLEGYRMGSMNETTGNEGTG